MGDSVRLVEGFGQHSMRRESKLNIVGVLFLLRDDGALLLQLRDEKPNLRHAGMWVPPGGHIEADESVEQGTRRVSGRDGLSMQEDQLVANDGDQTSGLANLFARCVLGFI
jgi:ADP-ribose pyrophosphatase YjhB (NUDIX family)